MITADQRKALRILQLCLVATPDRLTVVGGMALARYLQRSVGVQMMAAALTMVARWRGETSDEEIRELRRAILDVGWHVHATRHSVHGTRLWISFHPLSAPGHRIH